MIMGVIMRVRMSMWVMMILTVVMAVMAVW